MTTSTLFRPSPAIVVVIHRDDASAFGGRAQHDPSRAETSDDFGRALVGGPQGSVGDAVADGHL